MTIMFEKNYSQSEVRHHKRSQSSDWCQRTWCCVSDGIRRKSSTM